MGSFNIARESLTTAMNDSEGSAERELENYQKGIQYSLDKFQAQFQELSTNVINSDIFKGIVDGGTAAISILTELTSVAGGLPAAFAAIGGIKIFRNLDQTKSCLCFTLSGSTITEKVT